MKKILMIAPCSINNNIIGGAVAKNKALYNYLNEVYNVEIIDTYWVKKNILQYCYMRYINKVFWLLKVFCYGKRADAVVLGTNEDNYLKLLSGLKLLNRTTLFAIGGVVPQRVIDSKVSINVWKALKNIYVESDEMVNQLQNMGLTNASFLRNFKRLPKYDKQISLEKTDNLELFYHGKICAEKGIDCVIKAVKNVNAYGKKCCLYLYGEIEDGYCIPDDANIIYEGKLDLVNSLSDYSRLKKHDIFVFATKWKGEGLSGSVQDALALGKPILATKHNLNGQMVFDEYNGYLFERDDDKKLSELILSLYYDQDRMVEMGNNSLELAAEYRVEKVLEKIDLF